MLPTVLATSRLARIQTKETDIRFISSPTHQGCTPVPGGGASLSYRSQVPGLTSTLDTGEIVLLPSNPLPSEESAVLLRAELPVLGPLMQTGVIVAVHVAEGSAVTPGTKLADVRVDLSTAAPQDCPPISYFRLVAWERGWLRRWLVQPGDTVPTGACLALITSAADEPTDQGAGRPLRLASAGILPAVDWTNPTDGNP